MEKSPVPSSIWQVYLLPVLILTAALVYHCFMIMGLFSEFEPLEQIANQNPVLSGSHPLHQYHGYLGARTFLRRGRFSCYDPFFEAGYPKSPIFDSGSRLSELFMVFGCDSFTPSAYKIGVIVLCMAFPLTLLLAGIILGIRMLGTAFAVLLGVVIFWSTPGWRLLEAGELDLMAGSLMLLLQVVLLGKYDWAPGFFSWAGLLLTAAGGWFLQPILFTLLIPWVLFYYLRAGVKHRSLAWHLAFWTAQLGAFGLNILWLEELAENWWIQSPLPPSILVLPHRTFRTVWEANLWGTWQDRACSGLVIVFGTMGCWLLIRQGRKVIGRILALSGATLLLLALLGICWEPSARQGTSRLLIPALLFCCLPSAFILSETICLGISVGGFPWFSRIWTLGGKLICCGSLVLVLVCALSFHQQTRSLQIGLDSQEMEIVEIISAKTTTKARILWDAGATAPLGNWTPLLSLLTDRYFIGGVDLEGRIEHSHSGFVRHQLAGIPLSQWGDENLRDYCRKYNIGWIVSSSPATESRFRQWENGVRELARFGPEGKRVLFEVLHHQASYALVGSVEVLEMNERHIALANVVPKDGKVVLSLHYQTGMRIFPSRVQIEREPDAVDSIPLIRLRLTTPASRVIISWP